MIRSYLDNGLKGVIYNLLGMTSRDLILKLNNRILGLKTRKMAHLDEYWA